MLTGPLHLHELCRIEHHDVRVHMSVSVLEVGQIQPLFSLHDTDRDGGDELSERRGCAGSLREPRAGVGERDTTAGDARRPSAAIGLKHVAIDPDGMLPERHRGHRGTKRATDETLDFLRAAAGAVPLARGPFDGGPRQHGVFRRDPSLSGPLLESRNTGFDRGRAMNQGPSHPDETGSFGVWVGLALENQGTQCGIRPAVRTGHGDAPQEQKLSDRKPAARAPSVRRGIRPSRRPRFARANSRRPSRARLAISPGSAPGGCPHRTARCSRRRKRRQGRALWRPGAITGRPLPLASRRALTSLLSPTSSADPSRLAVSSSSTCPG